MFQMGFEQASYRDVARQQYPTIASLVDTDARSEEHVQYQRVNTDES